MQTTIQPSNMEIKNMTNDQLLNVYLKCQESSNQLDMTMGFIKGMMKQRLVEDNIENFANPNGEFIKVTQQRNNFTASLAKEFLTEEQIEKCKVPKEISYIKVISAQAKKTQEAAMQLDN